MRPHSSFPSLPRRAHFLAWFVGLALGIGPPAQAAWEGKVVGVSDGDTVTVLDQTKTQHKIRLAGIDAPEKVQAYGQRAKESLSSLVYGQWVTVDGDKTDRYGRTVAKLWVAAPSSPCRSESTCARSVDANLAQITRGMAWWYRQYAREQSTEDRSHYAEAEEQARHHGVGLWQDLDPQSPWDWRHKRHQPHAQAAIAPVRW